MNGRNDLIASQKRTGAHRRRRENGGQWAVSAGAQHV